MKDVEQDKPKKVVPDWVREETKTADLGDKRLNVRLNNLLEMLGAVDI